MIRRQPGEDLGEEQPGRGNSKHKGPELERLEEQAEGSVVRLNCHEE